MSHSWEPASSSAIESNIPEFPTSFYGWWQPDSWSTETPEGLFPGAILAAGSFFSLDFAICSSNWTSDLVREPSANNKYRLRAYIPCTACTSPCPVPRNKAACGEMWFDSTNISFTVHKDLKNNWLVSKSKPACPSFTVCVWWGRRGARRQQAGLPLHHIVIPHAFLSKGGEYTNTLGLRKLMSPQGHIFPGCPSVLQCRNCSPKFVRSVPWRSGRMLGTKDAKMN